MSKAKGVVAKTHPIPPMAIRIPAVLANSFRLNHSLKIFIVGTKTPAALKPMRTLANMAIEVLIEIPKRIVLMQLIRRDIVIVILGPK
jgi:hypothetical protein